MVRQISPVLRNLAKFSRIGGNHNCVDCNDKLTIRANLEHLGCQQQYSGLPEI